MNLKMCCQGIIHANFGGIPPKVMNTVYRNPPTKPAWKNSP